MRLGRWLVSLRRREADDCGGSWDFELTADLGAYRGLGGDLERWRRSLSLGPVADKVCGALPRAEIYAAAGGGCRWWAEGKEPGERVYALSLLDAVLGCVGFWDDALVRAGREDDAYRLLLAEARSLREQQFDLPR